MSDKNKTTYHALTMTPPGTWIKLLWENGGVEPTYWRRIASTLLISSIFSPWRIMEKIKYGGVVARTKIDTPPIFIIGFARSGTTHLHNLITRDPQFGTITHFQAVMPTMFLVGRRRLKKIIEKYTSPTRPMDNVKLSTDMPQEEEIAIANSCHVSLLHHLSFPKKTTEYIDKYALMRGLTEREQARWDQVLVEILKKATLDNNGKQLVLKSPTNTGRISHLLRLFPEAKFINIVRNPYHVYRSMVHFYKTILPIYQLQTIEQDEIENNIVQLYKKLMGQYLEEKDLIPSENFTEVRYENIEERPLEELERVYSDLSLPNWDQAEHNVSNYLKTITNYKKNALRLEQSEIDRVSKEFRFTLDNWNYKIINKLIN